MLQGPPGKPPARSVFGLWQRLWARAGCGPRADSIFARLVAGQPASSIVAARDGRWANMDQWELAGVDVHDLASKPYELEELRQAVPGWSLEAMGRMGLTAWALPRAPWSRAFPRAEVLRLLRDMPAERSRAVVLRGLGLTAADLDGGYWNLEALRAARIPLDTLATAPGKRLLWYAGAWTEARGTASDADLAKPPLSASAPLLAALRFAEALWRGARGREGLPPDPADAEAVLDGAGPQAEAVRRALPMDVYNRMQDALERRAPADVLPEPVPWSEQPPEDLGARQAAEAPLPLPSPQPGPALVRVGGVARPLRCEAPGRKKEVAGQKKHKKRHKKRPKGGRRRTGTSTSSGTSVIVAPE